MTVYFSISIKRNKNNSTFCYTLLGSWRNIRRGFSGISLVKNYHILTKWTSRGAAINVQYRYLGHIIIHIILWCICLWHFTCSFFSSRSSLCL